MDQYPSKSEVSVVWYCAKCGATGIITFPSYSIVADRLRIGEEDHRQKSPTCKLEWERVFVQSERVEAGALTP